MADEKSHTQQGQIERAQRLRAVIENLKEGKPSGPTSPESESLKEQIDKRAQKAEKKSKSLSRRK